MKYCLPYSQNLVNEYRQEAEELIFKYSPEHNIDLAKVLLDVHDKFKKQRIIVGVESTHSYLKWGSAAFKELKKKVPSINLAIRFNQYMNSLDEELKSLTENNIDFFFNKGVDSWDEFNFLISLGVSDIYITNEMGFELNLVGAQALASEISIRALANICQTLFPSTGTLKSFFIRPDAVFIYDDVIDVLEFVGDTNTQNMMYKIYKEKEKWFGNLQEIIIGLDTPLDSRCIPPVFDRARFKCGKKCFKGAPCKICEASIKTAESLNNKNIFLKKKN